MHGSASAFQVHQTSSAETEAAGMISWKAWRSRGGRWKAKIQNMPAHTNTDYKSAACLVNVGQRNNWRLYIDFSRLRGQALMINFLNSLEN